MPDGIARPEVLRALVAGVAFVMADRDLKLLLDPKIRKLIPCVPMHFGPRYAYHPSEMRTSEERRTLMAMNENGCDWEQTAYLHSPGGESGVTLGPGYDMRDREEDEIKATLKKIGVRADIAEKIASEARGLSHDEADDYARHYGRNGTGGTSVHLDERQQRKLMSLYLGPKENLLRRYDEVLLLQHEFDALVSFTVNASASALTVYTAINEGRVAEALEIILHRIPPAFDKKGNRNKVRQGIIRRRQREVEFYLTGRIYG